MLRSSLFRDLDVDGRGIGFPLLSATRQVIPSASFFLRALGCSRVSQALKPPFVGLREL